MEKKVKGLLGGGTQGREGPSAQKHPRLTRPPRSFCLKEEPGSEPTGQEVALSYPNHFQITGGQPPQTVTLESESLEFKSYLSCSPAL